MGFFLLERHSLAVILQKLLQAAALAARDERVDGSVPAILRFSTQKPHGRRSSALATFRGTAPNRCDSPHLVVVDGQICAGSDENVQALEIAQHGSHVSRRRAPLPKGSGLLRRQHTIIV